MGSVCLRSSIPRRFRGRKIVSAQREIVFISTNDCGVARGSYKHSEHTSSLTYPCDGKVGQCMTALVMSRSGTRRAEGVFTGFWSLGAPDFFFFQLNQDVVARCADRLILRPEQRERLLLQGDANHTQTVHVVKIPQQSATWVKWKCFYAFNPLHYITGHMVPPQSLSLYVLITFRLVFWRAGPEFIV